MRILIAEDDFIGRKMLQKFLVQYGECSTAVNGKEAVAAFLESHRQGMPFDLICLDIMMPVMDGLKALKAIREWETQKGIGGTSRVKVIVTTALNDYRTIQASHDTGCEAYAWKPINLSRFQEALVKLGVIPA